VAPTWPDFVTNEDGLWWVRLDVEDQAEMQIARMELGRRRWPDDGEFERVGRRVMVRDVDNYAEDGLRIADPTLEHDDAAVYVEFWTWA
jgi:hypothetical protein